MKWLPFFTLCFLPCTLPAQTVSQKLEKSFQQFENDSQMKHAISSLYVIDAKTGQVVFDKNSQVGLAGASTQKIITAATAFELLGKGYKYRTPFYFDGKIINDTLKGDLLIRGVGDPTFGSNRYSTTGRKKILFAVSEILSIKKIKYIDGNVIIDENSFESNTIPDGWIWQDIGNYYGAGAGGINWNENQYDLFLRPGAKQGDDVEIIGTEPTEVFYSIINELKTGSKGSGDNGYIYIAPYTVNGFVRGTIPLGQKEFSISGAMPIPSLKFIEELRKEFDDSKITVSEKFTSSLEYKANKKPLKYDAKPSNYIVSPSLDSIIYWFLKKSINLYGEALIKTFAYEKQGVGSNDSGVSIVKKFWKQKGLDEDELNMYDGSGLSPLNRITTHAQVEILKYARTKDWFQSFYNALPEYNGMKMKSGTISDVKGFCGYHKAKDGKEYIFSFLVNNYSGKTSGVVNKMYKVLDELK
ncbi:MAG: D-alanyl-D-alanine carboxypeptidase/D-alanyl-D-alanine-endopeptidase [Bacteroidota bacterium]|nr:D-alanyl-D-alanine carboxypeptidase/D-alanyl-D-alanine-endopeptidase [Bacteroidota bacterium]